MQAAQYRDTDDLTRSSFALGPVWRACDPLFYPLMRPAFVVEGRVFIDYTIQMPLAENEHVIEAFSRRSVPMNAHSARLLSALPNTA